LVLITGARAMKLFKGTESRAKIIHDAECYIFVSLMIGLLIGFTIGLWVKL